MVILILRKYLYKKSIYKVFQKAKNNFESLLTQIELIEGGGHKDLFNV